MGAAHATALSEADRKLTLHTFFALRPEPSQCARSPTEGRVGSKANASNYVRFRRAAGAHDPAGAQPRLFACVEFLPSSNLAFTSNHVSVFVEVTVERTGHVLGVTVKP
jgi:hypothetical protein